MAGGAEMDEIGLRPIAGTCKPQGRSASLELCTMYASAAVFASSLYKDRQRIRRLRARATRDQKPEGPQVFPMMCSEKLLSKGVAR